MLGAIYGLDKINSDPKILGKIKLGLDILEECDVPVSHVKSYGISLGFFS